MSNPVESKSPGGDLEEVEAQPAAIDHTADLDENAEHRMGVLEAVRLYPMATFWAFVMSSTIVSYQGLHLKSRS
jgi:SP family general alpha glucoside:H+ symporter-like MFS transporter